MPESDFRKLFLLSRLAITLAVFFIASGLLFFNSTDVKSNIASSLLGALMGYWFSIDGSEGAKHIQNGGVTQVNATIQDTDSAGQRTASQDTSNAE